MTRCQPLEALRAAEQHSAIFHPNASPHLSAALRHTVALNHNNFSVRAHSSPHCGGNYCPYHRITPNTIARCKQMSTLHRLLHRLLHVLMMFPVTRRSQQTKPSRPKIRTSTIAAPGPPSQTGPSFTGCSREPPWQDTERAQQIEEYCMIHDLPGSREQSIGTKI